MNKVIAGIGLSLACLTITACQVNKTQDGKAPAIKVQATGGELPKYDVKGPDVNVGTKKETVEVPVVHVTPAADKK